MESDASASASAALDSAGAARHAAAERLRTPSWYYPALGLLVAQHVLAQGLDERNWTLPSSLLLIGGAVVLVLVRRRVTGVSVTGPTSTASRHLLALMCLTAAASIVLAALVQSMAIGAIAAVVALVVTVVTGPRYDEALRDERR
jgi:CHASE2 domain-containing sensor protein